MGDRASALANAQKAREIMEPLVARDPANQDKVLTTVSVYNHIADSTADHLSRGAS